LFEQSFIEEPGRGVKPAAIAASFLLQCLLLAGAALTPLLYTYELPIGEWLRHATLLAPPPPPRRPAAPAPAAARAAPRPAPARFQAFMAPSEIPDEVHLDRDAPLALDAWPAPDIGGVHGGVAGGIDDGVLGATGGLQAAVFIPEKPLPVGGNVQAARIISRVSPVYPSEALEQRISGTVYLEAIITAEGVVREIKLLQGDPLLAASALEAVQQWRYRPTFLNGRPVEVITQIKVVFAFTEPPEPRKSARQKGRKR
jgi:protein TonB